MTIRTVPHANDSPRGTASEPRRPFRWLGVVAAATVATVGITACSDDSDNAAAELRYLEIGDPSVLPMLNPEPEYEPLDFGGTFSQYALAPDGTDEPTMLIRVAPTMGDLSESGTLASGQPYEFLDAGNESPEATLTFQANDDTEVSLFEAGLSEAEYVTAASSLKTEGRELVTPPDGYTITESMTADGIYALTTGYAANDSGSTFSILAQWRADQAARLTMESGGMRFEPVEVEGWPNGLYAAKDGFESWVFSYGDSTTMNIITDLQLDTETLKSVLNSIVESDEPIPASTEPADYN